MIPFDESSITGGIMLRTLYAALFVAIFAAPARADEWPYQKITIVSPYPVAGTADLIARLIAENLEHRLKQPVVVVEKLGASGMTGSLFVAKANPDGYTLLVGSAATHSIIPYFEAHPPYDAEKDFIPVAFVARVPNVLVINPAIPAKTVPELITYLKANPDAATYGSAGAGTTQHLAAELFSLKTGIRLTHVPLRGGNEIMDALATGKIQMAFNNALWAWPLARAGKVRALGVTNLKPSPSMPGLPAIADTIPGYEASSWFGLFVPAGTPQHIVDKLSTEISEVLRRPFVTKQLTTLGAEMDVMSSIEFTGFCSIERLKWREVVKAVKTNGR